LYRRDFGMEWKIQGESVVHDSPWLKLVIADVMLPNGKRIQHSIVRYPAPTAGVLLHDIEKAAVLLLWRHRFITNRWGWEIPAGLAEPGEDIAEAAARETLEETGYNPLDPVKIVEFNTSSGIMDEVFHGYYSTKWKGSASEGENIEADKVQWVPISEVESLVQQGMIPHGHSLMTILAAFHRGLLKA